MDTRKPLSLVVSTIMVVSILATPAAAGMVASGSTDDGAQTFQDTETLNLTESIDMWDSAPLPLRITNDPDFNIQNPALLTNYKPGNTGPVDIRKDEFAVYDKNERVYLQLNAVTGADTEQFAGNNTQLVVAHLESEDSKTLSDISSPGNLGEARDLLTPENANSNASFKVIDSGEIDNLGEFKEGSTDFKAEKSGVYVAFLATGNEFGTDSENNLTLTGNPTTIVGMETVLVREQPAVIDTADTAEPGDDVTFTVDSPSTANNHTVILYKESQWQNAEFELVIEEEFSTSMQATDFTFRHSIDEVNGDTTFDGPVTVMGTTFYDKSFTGATSTPTLLDFVVETANNNTAGDDISEIPTYSTGDGVLDASATGVSDQGSLTVNTYENWSEGEYRWVYLGSGSAETNFYTEEGTITIKEAPEENDDEDVSPSPSPGGGGGGDDGGGATAPPEEVEDIPASSTANIGGNNPVLRFDSGEFFSNVGFTSQAGLDAIVSVTEVREPPAPGPTGAQFVAGADITFSSGDPGQVDTVQMGVQKTRLQSLGVSSNQLTINHYNEETGEWEELETTISYEDNFEVIVEAPSAGFSTYAVFAQQDDDVTTTEPAPTTEQPTTTEPGPTTTTMTTTEAPPTTPPEEDEGFPLWIVGLFIVLLIGLGVAYYLWGWDTPS